MSTNLTRALKVLAAATMLATAIASPSLAQSAGFGAKSVPYYHGQSQANRDAHRGDWDSQ